MKVLKNLFLVGAAALTMVSCSDEVAKQDLKSSLEQNVSLLSKAVDEISASPEFAYLGMTSENGMMQVAAETVGLPESDTVRNVLLSDIAGVYEYAWVKTRSRNLLKMFTRTGDSDKLIVKLPASKVTSTKSLFGWNKGDTTLVNNFTAEVSEFAYTRSTTNGLEYKIVSDFTIDSTAIGQLAINKTVNRINGFDYSSVYTLASGYVITRTENSGDTAVSVYAITKDNVTLYEEKISSILTNDSTEQREKTYSLTVGNVQIVKLHGLSNDSAQVYVDGVLQEGAVVSTTKRVKADRHSMVKKERDMTITLQDGTVIVMSQLMNGFVENIAVIFNSVNQAMFTTQIIDKIAFNIYQSKQVVNE